MLALGFHRIEPPTGLEITRIGRARFERLLAMIEAAGLQGRTGDPAATAAGQVMLTFDDGYRSVTDAALPMLAQRAWSAVVFLIAGSVGKTDDWDVSLLGPKRRMMSWSDAREWAGQEIEFGSHTVTHADLTALSDRSLETELRESKTMIEEELGRPVRYLAYPFGRHNLRVRAAAQEAGYEAAFATGAGLSDDRFAIPRAMIHGLTTLFEFRAILRKAERDEESRPVHRGSWRSRFFQDLNAGSATVSNWRRARQSRNQNYR
jgi:peptidoglycan/xylan/chitin deacetylase (PgdA/CDA1 family)